MMKRKRRKKMKAMAKGKEMVSKRRRKRRRRKIKEILVPIQENKTIRISDGLEAGNLAHGSRLIHQLFL